MVEFWGKTRKVDGREKIVAGAVAHPALSRFLFTTISE
jgi:hypothetical protein